MIYQFFGVNFKTEIRIGLLSGLLFIATWVLSIVFYYQFNQLNSIHDIPENIFFGAMFLGCTVFLFLLRFLGLKFRQLWFINIDEQHRPVFIIKQKGKEEEKIDIVQELNSLIYIGTRNELRYLKIKSTRINYKIRVGTSLLAPFSNKVDINTLDNFINNLERILQDNQFQIKKVKTKSNSFEYRFENATICK